MIFHELKLNISEFAFDELKNNSEYHGEFIDIIVKCIEEGKSVASIDRGFTHAELFDIIQ